MKNLLIGGSAGDGIDTMVTVLEKSLKKAGYYVYTTRDFMSRVRGGHNFTQLRFGEDKITSHSDILDGIIAMNDETVQLHRERLKDVGFILGDTALKTDDPRAIKLDFAGAAKSAGNAKTIGIAIVGAVIARLGEPPELTRKALTDAMKPKLLPANLLAFDAGYQLIPVAADTHTRADADFSKDMLIMGGEAMALGAIAGGLRFFSAYPMSPSTSVMNFLQMHQVSAGIVVEQAEDEIAAINMALGAAYAGAPSMIATSGGGFSLMVEALGLSGIAEIPVVMANVQRPGPATGLPTRTEQSDLKFVISASQGEFPRMVIAVKSVADAFYQTARALKLADMYQLPVILLSDQYLADLSDTVPLFSPEDNFPPRKMALPDDTGTNYLSYKLTPSGISPRLIPGKSGAIVRADSDEHEEEGIITESALVRKRMVDKRMAKLDTLHKELIEPDYFGADDAEVLLLGFGSLYGPLQEAVAALNNDSGTSYGALVFGDLFPLPTKRLEKHIKSAVRIINVEQNATGQLAGILREYAGVTCTDSILKYDGRQISGEEIVSAVTAMGGKTS